MTFNDWQREYDETALNHATLAQRVIDDAERSGKTWYSVSALCEFLALCALIFGAYWVVIKLVFDWIPAAIHALGGAL